MDLPLGSPGRCGERGREEAVERRPKEAEAGERRPKEAEEGEQLRVWLLVW